MYYDLYFIPAPRIARSDLPMNGSNNNSSSNSNSNKKGGGERERKREGATPPATDWCYGIRLQVVPNATPLLSLTTNPLSIA